MPSSKLKPKSNQLNNHIFIHFIQNQCLHSLIIKQTEQLSTKMARSTTKDAQALIRSLRSAYTATPTNLKIIDLYIVFAIATALLQVVYMALVGSFPFNSFLSGELSCVGTAVLAGKLLTGSLSALRPVKIGRAHV